MDGDFVTRFGEGSKALLKTPSPSIMGVEILKIFEEEVKKCMKENNIKNKCKYAHWKDNSDSLIVSLKLDGPTGTLVNVYKIDVQREAEETDFVIKGSNEIEKDHSFKTTKKHEEIDVEVVQTLLLELIKDE